MPTCTCPPSLIAATTLLQYHGKPCVDLMRRKLVLPRQRAAVGVVIGHVAAHTLPLEEQLCEAIDARNIEG